MQLPAATQVGANTFGCLVNGQVWEANNTRTLAGKVITPTVRYHGGELQLDAFRRLQVDGPISNFHFVVGHVTGPGVYELSQSQPGRQVQLKTASGLVEYVATEPQAGTLTITRLDTTGAHPFVAGRFELRAVPGPAAPRSADLLAEVRITEGRFDIQLNP
ncbi:hypothetical protein AUC43_06195 [Hymenobacter sedentarius]|uniref:Uncharacterized protein n=1 Tax=Hymenobacter sedentarius TaxID=1411621 RepID=A0A0U3SW31_9BACT|nr:hypothetical protein [Hymenobacter sedentarius]ALW84707.1 hypothetical protein AUC43_06195 [Hymenobacter sedentarius]